MVIKKNQCVRFILIGMFILELCACQSSQAPMVDSAPVPMSWSEQQRQKAAIKSWVAEGGFAVKQGSKGWSGSFEWIQKDSAHYDLHFYGPFGTGNTQLTGSPGNVVLENSQGVSKAESADLLLFQKTGFLFPVSYIYDWIRGIPAKKDARNLNFDQYGRLIDFQQGGWYIFYKGYTLTSSGELPSDILLKYNDVSIKILIRSWKKIEI